MTYIDLISGFTGSGKTTLIQKLLKEVYPDKKVYIIQNESGAVKLDTLNQPDNIRVKLMLNGCLCCNNSRDFEMTMKTILESGEFEQVIIELSGTTQLSDLLFLVQERLKSGLGSISHIVTVVNPTDFITRVNISERFFKRQIQYSPFVFLSRLDLVSEEETEPIRKQILQWKPDCVFLEHDLRFPVLPGKVKSFSLSHAARPSANRSAPIYFPCRY